MTVNVIGSAAQQQYVPLAQAGQTPGQLPVPAGAAANVGTLPVAMRADAVHASYGTLGWLGSGVDGAATFDGTAAPAGVSRHSSTLYSATRDLNYTTMVISAGVTLDMAGFILYVQGTITGPPSGSAAVITCAPASPSGTNQGTPASVAALYAVGRALALGVGWPGATGTTGVGAQISISTAAYSGSILSQSGSGGAGSAGAGGSGFGGGTPNVDIANSLSRFETAVTGRACAIDTLSLTNPYYAWYVMGGYGGGSGAGDSTNVGGAGGCGGNVVVVNARIVTGIINVTAPGGIGGAPTTGNCGGGGGGAGGVAWLNSADLTAWTGAISAAGGPGGAKIGTGVAGGSGAAGQPLATTWL